jgi:peptide chain release factor 3
MAEDIDASPIFLGKSAWEINYVAERYPDLQFLRTRERG